MRVAFLTYFYLPEIGGIQVLLDRVSRGLCRQWGHDVLVVTRPWSGKPAQEHTHGVCVRRIAHLSQNQPVALGVTLWRILRSYQADILICVEPRLRWSLPALAVTRKLRIPLLLLLAGTYSETAHPVSRWIAGVGADMIIGDSHYALRQYAWWPSRWRLIYNGVDVNPAVPPVVYEKRRDLVLTVARVNPRKNLEVVIRVAHLLPSYQFLIVGDTSARPDYYQTLQRLVETLQVSNVVFTGEVPDATRDGLYQQARLFFLPTRHEMFGIVFAEAMAAGLPIVTTNTTAIPELVTPQVGRLLPLHSPPETFAQEIQRLMSHGETWHTLSANAFERAAKFQWDRTVRGYAEACAQLVYKGDTDANAKR